MSIPLPPPKRPPVVAGQPVNAPGIAHIDERIFSVSDGKVVVLKIYVDNIDEVRENLLRFAGIQSPSSSMTADTPH